MRMSKTIQQTIFENLLADKHPLTVRAHAAQQAESDAAGAFLQKLKAKMHTDDAAIEDCVNGSNKLLDGLGIFVNASHIAATRVVKNEKGGIYNGNIRVQANGSYTYVSLSGMALTRNLSSDIPKLADLGDKYTGVVVPSEAVLADPDSDIAKTILDIQAEVECINRELSSFKSTLFATLSQYRTTEKLVAAWPEIEPYIPKSAQPVTATGVALSPSMLNAICGIPKK